MYEYFTEFIGQTNSNTTFLGYFTSDPVYTGNNSEYFYNTTDNVWKVGGSGWTVVADPSTLAGATIITDPSEVDGNFVENKDGVRYIYLYTIPISLRRVWFQFYARTETKLPDSAGSWPTQEVTGFGTNVGNPFGSEQSFRGTNNNDRGTIDSPGWFQLGVDFRSYKVFGGQAPNIRCLPRMLFVYSQFVNNEFFFLLEAGRKTTARTQHLSLGEVSALYDLGLLFSVPHGYTTLTSTYSRLVFYLNPPPGAQRVYPVGIDTRGAVQEIFSGGDVGIQALVRSSGATFGSFGSVWGMSGIEEDASDPTDPVDPTDPAIRCLDPDYYIEAYELCSQLVPPPLCLDRGLFPNGGDCPTESNASVYFTRRNKTFCPVELI